MHAYKHINISAIYLYVGVISLTRTFLCLHTFSWHPNVYVAHISVHTYTHRYIYSSMCGCGLIARYRIACLHIHSYIHTHTHTCLVCVRRDWVIPYISNEMCSLNDLQLTVKCIICSRSRGVGVWVVHMFRNYLTDKHKWLWRRCPVFDNFSLACHHLVTHTHTHKQIRLSAARPHMCAHCGGRSWADKC